MPPKATRQQRIGWHAAPADCLRMPHRSLGH